MKYIIAFLIAFIVISCEKDYECVCTSTSTEKDTLVDHIKTTKLGSKGYKKTCTNKESRALSNCRLQ